MALQIRRGTDAERASITPLVGELVYTTDTKEVYVGDGVSQGGIPVSKYTDGDAKDAVADSLVNATHTGLEFVYNPISKLIEGTVTINPGISEVADDTSPSLSGGLNLNGNDIFGTGNVNVSGNVLSSGTIQSPIFKVTSFADEAARDAAIPVPEAGMIIFVLNDGTGNPKFQGYVDAGDSTVGGWKNLN